MIFSGIYCFNFAQHHICPLTHHPVSHASGDGLALVDQVMDCIARCLCMACHPP